MAKVGTTALGTIRSVEYVLQNLDDTATSIEQQIATTQKRHADLTVQAAQAFEYEERLATLTRRQQEIEDELDLTKSQASSTLEAEAEEDASVVQAEEEAVPA